MTVQPIVLYVEDDPRSRKVMEMCLKLKMRLSNFTIFEDSSRFLERVQSLDPRPNLVFLDIHVKPNSGFQMLEMLRSVETFKHVPVIALTASVMNEEVHMLQTAGFDGCLSKPLDMETFPDNLKRLLNGEHVWRII